MMHRQDVTTESEDKMALKNIQDYIQRHYPDDQILLADGFECAFLGVVESFGIKPRALYDRDACVDILIERDGMEYDEALEYFSFNVEQAYVGEYTPAFIKLDIGEQKI